MYRDNLYKGFEIELFTGTYNSHVGLSDQVEKNFSNFVKEPDNRNVEYITEPSKDYKELYGFLLQPRQDLRKWLSEKNLTIIPSSTLCFKHDSNFRRSDNLNNYHDFIESNYGISIATSSVHINLGIDKIDKLFAAIRLVRCEASVYLGLSASSPFLNGEYTGNHSQRWLQFPKTPAEVPFFKDHRHYINWVDSNLKSGKMQNIRHFWSSIRPNGPQRPFELDRLELRICDFISDIDLLLAVTALLELRVLYLFENIDSLDPLMSSNFSLKELQYICENNEKEVAKNSLNAELIHWKDGRRFICNEWIQNLLDEITFIAKQFNMDSQLDPIRLVLQNGNQSMRWIKSYEEGNSVEEIMKCAINDMIKSE